MKLLFPFSFTMPIDDPMSSPAENGDSPPENPSKSKARRKKSRTGAEAEFSDPIEEWVDPESTVWQDRLLRIGLAIGLATVLVGLLLVSKWGRDQPRKIDLTELSDKILFRQKCVSALESESTILHVQGFPVTDKMFQDAKQLTSLENLILDRGAVGDPSIAAIAAMPNLNQLRLRLSPISDEGFATLANSQSISIVNVPHATCTSQGVGKLKEMPKLLSLRLGSTGLSGDVARTIAGIENLRTLHLIGVPITDDGLRYIAAMPRLESLYLDDSAVTDAGWRWLFDNHTHLHVHINQEHHDRDPQRHKHR